MASPSSTLNLVARLGFVAKGVLYATVGLLALQAAIGMGGRITNSDGALRTILRQPFGHVLLLILAIGLFGYAAWRMIEGIADTDRRGKNLKGVAMRAGSVFRGILHAYFGWKVFRLYRGVSAEGHSEDQLVAETFAWPLGHSLVIVCGLAVLSFAVYQIVRAAKSNLGRHFDLERMRRDMGTWAVTACRLGLAARGVVFAIIAWFLIQAGVTGRASKTAGTREVFRVVASWPQPVGSWLLAGVGAGLAAYGAFQILNAKYRTIETSLPILQSNYARRP